MKLSDQPGCKVYLNLSSLKFCTELFFRSSPNPILKDKTSESDTVIVSLGPSGWCIIG